MLAAQSVVDLDVFPSDASTAVALVSSPVLLDSSNNNFFTQVFETTDDGVTWAPVGVPLDPTVIVTTIDVPKSDPTRIYVSGTRGFGGGITASLFVYTTASGVWVEQPIPGFDPSVEDSVYIGAVDPNDADVVYLRSRGLAGGGQSRLFVTRNASASPADGGATFTEPAGASFDVPDVTGTEIVGQLEGFALSPDGSKVYVGTEESGVWMAPATTLAFTQMNAKPVTQGLATRLTPQGTTELWACSKASGGFVVGVSTDDGATFEAKLCSITGLTGVASCPAVSNPTLGCAAPGDTRAVCPMVLSDFCAVYTGGACEPCGGDEGGAGSDAAPPDAGTAAAAKKPSSCGCSAVGSSGDADGALAGLFVAAMAFARRRRHESRLD
jgi:MYXO-CTERM domain-containing protein